MLHKKAFANAVAVLTAVVYAVAYVLFLVTPGLFAFLLNAQVFGADLAGQISDLTFGNFLAMGVATAIIAWFAGYFLAYLYNRFSRN